MAGLSKYASPGHFNDPDFLELEWFESDLEAQTQISFWALWAAPYVVATDPRKKSKRMEMFTNPEVVAISQDSLVQAGDLRINNTDGSQVWSRVLSGATPRWAVIVYNSKVWPWEGHVSNVLVPFNAQVLPQLPLSNITLHVRDVFGKVNLGPFTGSFKASALKPRESRLYTLE
jgi:hypothetical protein